jgi:hypothetical protein
MRANSIAAVTFLLGETTGGCLNDGRPLAWCQFLHALDLTCADVSDVFAPASCHTRQTLTLTGTHAVACVCVGTVPMFAHAGALML